MTEKESEQYNLDTAEYQKLLEAAVQYTLDGCKDLQPLTAAELAHVRNGIVEGFAVGALAHISGLQRRLSAIESRLALLVQ